MYKQIVIDKYKKKQVLKNATGQHWINYYNQIEIVNWNYTIIQWLLILVKNNWYYV